MGNGHLRTRGIAKRYIEAQNEADLPGDLIWDCFIHSSLSFF